MRAYQFTAKDIASAFNQHSHNLLAMESTHCCNGTKSLIIANEYVVLRRMLETLGYPTEEIDKDLYAREALGEK